MLIKSIPSWHMKEHQATSESVFFNRRALLGGLGAMATMPAFAQRLADLPDPNASLYPAKRNAAFTLDRALTDEKIASTYNNYYEFGSSKDISKQAQALKIRPWSLVIDGMVNKPMTLNVDDLIKKMPLEERLLRFRCVEAWAMAVPWTGFTLKSLLSLVEPLSSAKYLKIQTFNDPTVASGQKQPWYPWPYTDGLTIEEASNDMAMLVTGVYGKPLPKQHGAPLRLITPWKYGFKQVKSIARITLTDKRPVSFWENAQASEYGFWANINPKVDHPRWSQATERMIDTSERVATQLFNGYAEQVAHLYKGLEKERLWA